MLHCTMEILSSNLLVGLEDLAADVAHARRHEDLGRLALLCYCELRPWARRAQEERLAELTWSMSQRAPASSRELFLQRVNAVIQELESVCRRAGRPQVADALHESRQP